jgi:phosphohistidine phosphatase
MRRLLLLRHAKAERSQPGEADLGRALIERGRKEAATMGAYMARHGVTPDRVLVSPALRAQETWQQMATAWPKAPASNTTERLYEASPQTLLALIKNAPADAHNLLVVGHNPGLHELAVFLVAAGDIEMREHLREKLPTSGLAVIDFAIDAWTSLHPQSGRLERFVSPRSLERGEF